MRDESLIWVGMPEWMLWASILSMSIVVTVAFRAACGAAARCVESWQRKGATDAEG